MESKMFSAIRRRLLAWNFIVLASLLIALGISIYFVTARTLYGEVNENLRENSRETFQAISTTRGFPFILPRRAYRGDAFYLTIDLGGRVMENPQGLSVSNSPDPEGVQRALEGRQYFGTVLNNGEHLRVLSTPVVNLSGEVLGVLQVGQSIESQRAALSRLAIILSASGAGALAIAMGGGWFLADRALVPIRRAFDRQRRFVADASHELRTPLALIRSSAELLARHSGQTIDENERLIAGIVNESEYLGSMVSSLLTLAHSDSGRLELRRDPVALDALAAGVCDDAQPLAASHGLTLTWQAPPHPPGPSNPIVVNGDSERLRQLLLLLLDNAFKYTPAGGSVAVRLALDGDDAVLTVADTGRGMLPEQLPHVFDRFYRAEGSLPQQPSGAGLGLSIAKVLVEGHGGTIGIESEAGRGATVRVRLPGAQAQAPRPGDPQGEDADLASERVPRNP